MVQSFYKTQLLFIVVLLSFLTIEACIAFWPDSNSNISVSNPIGTSQDKQVSPLPVFDTQSFTLQMASDFIDRPLFAESRRNAPKVKADSVVPDTQLADWQLTGIYRTENKLFAMIIKKNDPKNVLKINEQQKVAGWTVKSILNDRVILELNGTERTMDLRKSSASAKVLTVSP